VRSGPVVQVRETRQIMVLPVPNMDPAMAFRKPMFVLINRASASASEIVAGALQDYGRAVVVGDSRSHGKGTVQQILPLGDEGKLGSIKVTNASFFRINGASTQPKGVASDLVLPSAFDYFAGLGEDKLPNAIPWSTVAPARYRAVAELGPLIAELKTRSEARLADDARWQRHLRRMKRIEHVSNLVDVPLQLDKRRAFARDEQDLDELDEQLSDEGSTRKDREEARRAQDVVMDEALRILVDLVDLQGPIESLRQQSPAPAGTDSLFDRFFR
jgi:carboxyl-terminal processing protease